VNPLLNNSFVHRRRYSRCYGTSLRTFIYSKREQTVLGKNVSCAMLFDAMARTNSLRRMASSGMLHCVALVRTDVWEERRFLQESHSVTSHKTAFFIVTAVKTSNLTTNSLPSRHVTSYSAVTGDTESILVERKRFWWWCITFRITGFLDFPIVPNS
jgi:hypothetical protein